MSLETKVKTRKEFELRPVVRVTPYLLEGKDSPEILGEINGVIDSKYKRNPALKVLNLFTIEEIPILVGSNSLISPVINEVFAPKYRVALPEEVETTLQEEDPVRIKRYYYVDYGLVLDFSENNHDLAVEVFSQLPKELRDFDRLPALMVSYGLRNSSKGDYGVAPVYQEGTELRTAKILVQPTGKFNAKDSELIKSGLPSRLKGGTRTLYNPMQKEPSEEALGLSRLCLYGDLILNSNYVDLYSSYDYGRVVCIRGEATPQKFSQI